MAGVLGEIDRAENAFERGMTTPFQSPIASAEVRVIQPREASSSSQADLTLQSLAIRGRHADRLQTAQSQGEAGGEFARVRLGALGRGRPQQA